MPNAEIVVRQTTQLANYLFRSFSWIFEELVMRSGTVIAPDKAE